MRNEGESVREKLASRCRYMLFVYKNPLFIEHCNKLRMLSIWIAQNIERKAKNLTGHKFWARAGISSRRFQTAFGGFPP